jgi:short-subunit dehydrogenase
MAVAIITGASSGIGREFAKNLNSMLGIDEFWFIARREDRMEALRDELQVKAKIIKADLCVNEGIETVRHALEEENPKVSFLINAAGFGDFGAFDEISETSVARRIDLNAKALVIITHMVIPYMQKGGRINQLGSGS